MNQVTTKTITVGSAANQEITLPIITIGKGSRTIGIVGGVHGNEPESLFVIRELVARLRTARLSVKVKILPGANPLALIRNTREGAFDGADLNRSFPGNPDGTLTQRLAAAIFQEFRDCDIAFDIHSVVNWGTYMGMELTEAGPLLERTREINRLLAPPYIWKAIEGKEFSPTLANTLMNEGVCGVAIELPRLEFIGDGTLEKVAEGLLRVIQWPQGKRVPQLQRAIPVVADERRHRSDRGGIYTPLMKLMSKVKKGDVVGILTDLATMKDNPLRSKWTGILSVQSTRKVVRTGDKIYTVGQVVDMFR